MHHVGSLYILTYGARKLKHKIQKFIVLCLYITKVHGSEKGNPPQDPILKVVNKFHTFLVCFNTIPHYDTKSFKQARLLPSCLFYMTCAFISHIPIYILRACPTELPSFDGLSCCIYKTSPNWRIFGKHHTLDNDEIL